MSIIIAIVVGIFLIILERILVNNLYLLGFLGICCFLIIFLLLSKPKKKRPWIKSKIEIERNDFKLIIEGANDKMRDVLPEINKLINTLDNFQEMREEIKIELKKEIMKELRIKKEIDTEEKELNYIR